MTLLSVEEARKRILSNFQPVTTETTSLATSTNRVLAEDIVAADDLPLFDNSSMDGFAIRAADTSHAAPDSRVTLRVVADLPAGSHSTIFLASGEAARIMTGAQIPAGADAVIPVEDTDFNDRSAGTSAPKTVTISQATQPNENIRPRGMDVRVGDVVLQKGHRINAQTAGVLAMLGHATVQVYKRPRVALLSSGDELVEVDAAIP